jgi:predicted unusual protein kinase regulating ubiquinone biosynthesis (AarF/ABC1/UbiB family)
VSSLSTSRALRTVRLLSLPAGALALSVEGAARRVAGQDPEVVRRALRQRNAARTRRVLGDLKGGALKAGQLLSTVETLFPQDPDGTWRDTLTSFQESNPAAPFTDLEPVLAAELHRGPGNGNGGGGRRGGNTTGGRRGGNTTGGWRAALPELDPRAVAAASLGQVHRGRWHDGREVAVKVQYPGVREALTVDLRAISVVSRLTAVVARGMALPPLVAEMRERLVEELDYLREASVQGTFADAYRGDPDVVVPEVVTATPRVLVTEWLGGTPLSRVATHGSPAERDRAGATYQRFLLSGPERAGWLHTDPHPGNFRLLPDGRLGVLDFGSALPMPEGMPATFGRLISVLISGDDAEVLRGLTEEGFVRPGARLEVGKLVDYMAPFTEPARHERFTFTRDWLRGQFGRVNDPRNPDFAVALQLTMPPEHLFTHRVWLGIVGVLSQLEATVPIRTELVRWLPGFDPPTG